MPKLLVLIFELLKYDISFSISGFKLKKPKKPYNCMTTAVRIDYEIGSSFEYSKKQTSWFIIVKRV